MQEKIKPVILIYKDNKMYQYNDLDELIVSNMLSYYSTMLTSNYIVEVMERLHVGYDIIKSLLAPCVIDTLHNYVFTIHNVHAGVFTDAGVVAMASFDHDHVIHNRNHIVSRWNVLKSIVTESPISAYNHDDKISRLELLSDNAIVQVIDGIAKLVRNNSLEVGLNGMYRNEELEGMLMKSLSMYKEHLEFDYVNNVM